MWNIFTFHPFTPKFKKYILQTFKEKCMSEVVRIGSVILFHLGKLWKTKFSTLCDVTFLVRLQGKFEIDHSWEWKEWKVWTWAPLAFSFSCYFALLIFSPIRSRRGTSFYPACFWSAIVWLSSSGYILGRSACLTMEVWTPPFIPCLTLFSRGNLAPQVKPAAPGTLASR